MKNILQGTLHLVSYVSCVGAISASGTAFLAIAPQHTEGKIVTCAYRLCDCSASVHLCFCEILGFYNIPTC